jgi:DNA polymerase/3'-5' exonuclease PolX
MQKKQTKQMEIIGNNDYKHRKFRLRKKNINNINNHLIISKSYSFPIMKNW